MSVDLTNLKTLIGLSAGNDKFDDVLSLINDNTRLQLLFKLGLSVDDDVPKELSFIGLEVAVKRYNRLKNEGMASYTQEGESISFNSNDFDEFSDDIEEYRKRHNKSVLTTVDPFRKRVSE
ncbi:phage head-tail connector protein [Limosilactobacillus gorillae]|uniref:phage head-tail connector protein n=1 Tax=Limosilactobacillus gorillae TaxID=1450649 RepID=UPI000AE8E050|nr:phage head-tail connector protein [Limosilactobacillus gorillae]